MRFPAWFAHHPRLRNSLMFIVVAAVLVGGARLWTSGPDAVHITITNTGGMARHDPTTVLADRTIYSSTVAQRLQRDVAAFRLIPYWELFSFAHSCPIGPSGDLFFHAAYTVTWYRAGLPVEQVHSTDAACDTLQDDGVLVRWPYGAAGFAAGFYADINVALNAGG